MPKITQSLDAEQAEFDSKVRQIEEWWTSPRQKHIQRPYSSARIASLRGLLPQKYASSDMALKLWDLLNEHRVNGTNEMTFGVTDPIIASQMAKYQQTLYVSGALCGFSEVSEPGMDCCDYPLDTVPKVVDKIFKSQCWHSQRQNHYRMLQPKEARANLENWDYLTPIVADGDMGFGGLTSTVKMTKLFVEAGVAMFHLDDLAIGKKKFTVGQGRTVVPTSEYLDRLTAARMQIDIMGAETMLLCRCDVDHSEFITDVIDARDHKYVRGATVPVKSLQETLKEAVEAGSSNPLEVRKEWIKSANLLTFDEAVQAIATPEEYTTYTTKLGSGNKSLKDRRAIAKETVSKDIFFDWDLPRSREGQFFYKSCVSGIVERALLAAPLGDVTWARMDMPNWDDIVSFHEQVRAVFPDRLFAFGYTGDYDYPKAGFTPEKVKSFPSDMAKLGVAWQVQPIWALQGINYQTEKFAKLWKERGIEGYVEVVQKPALATKPLTDGFEKPSYSGSYLCDAFWDTVAVRDVGEGGGGKISENRIR
ncbi:related to Mitochondrial 2-methylisocitrate lyase [Phialocephala subalpina]|uniref:Isocitrate lyase n=1 Tax=Phialocephala subalpina TaxID=576137 RepID=A0A1L7XB25_9HELO|nr:related to Mitochondrial 2-methylisocitrate lyase [Phialocephala subalpina]